MELYMMNRQHGRMIHEFVENGPLIWPTIEENGVTRLRKYNELTHTDAIQANCDVKATNIILQGLPTEIYALVSHHKVAKNLWERIQLLMQGTSLTKQERECKLYDEFDKLAYKKGEILRDFYLRFSLLLNDLNIYNIKLEQFQVNTKFLNTLPPEWNIFVTDVKLVRDLHTTNIDQLYAYLGQHKFHANEVSIVTSRYPTTNNQLRNSLNPRQQATVNDGRVTTTSTGRQISVATGTTRTYTPGASGSNSRKQRTVICYNCKGEGHMSKQCTKPKKKRDDSWFKDKVLLVAAQNSNSSAQQDALILSVIEQLKTQNAEIDHLKQTLSEQLREKESLMKIVSVLKDGFKKEESRNINREIALEKKIKHLDNIVYQRDQSAQTLEPKLYDGNVMENSYAIVIPDSEETLMLAKESRSKMLLKQQDPMVLENKVNTKPVDYNSMNSSDPSLSYTPNKVEVPKELPKVSMVNTSLKKLKHHLAGFDKDIFNNFDQYLIDELTEVQNVFHQMEQAVEQHCLESKTFEVKMNQVLNENDRLLEQVINKDIVNIVVNSSMDNASVNENECIKCLKLETELINNKDFIEKETYDKLFRKLTALEKHCISLEVATQLNQEIFQRDNSVSNQSAPTFDQYFELNELKAQSQEKDTVIRKLKERIKSLCLSKLIAENEHLKQTYKQLYDSIKPTSVRSKEQCDALINQVNQKYVEISDLNAKLQEQGLLVTALKNKLRKLKGKDLVDDTVTKHYVDPEMLKIDVQPIASKLLKNRTTYSDYLKHTQEQVAIRREVVEQGKSLNPLNNSLDFALAVTPKNKDKRVRFTKPVTSSGNTNTKPDSASNLVSNKPVLSSTGVRPSTNASGSQPSGNTKKDKIHQPPSSTLKNKVEAHPRTVKSSLKNKNYVVEPNGTAHVQHSKLNANFELICVKCNGCMLSDNHDLCVLNDVNVHAKSKSVKKNSKGKVVQIVLWYLDSGCSKHMIEDRSQLTNFVNKFMDTVKFGNDHVAKITRYGDYQIRNVTISRVYYVEGLGHNLFSVGQLCYSNLEVAFRQHTCFIHNLEGVDLLTGSRGNNLYTLSLRDMMASSPICLLSKASKTKSWLWHRHLSHLNFGAINHLARHGLFLDFIIKFLTMIQVRLKAPVRRIRTDNGTEFVNQTLCEYYEKVGISHETSVARSPQQNGVVERRNRTLIETARTMTRAKPSSFNIICTTFKNCDLLFQPLFDELINLSSSVDSPAPKVIAPIAEVVALEPAVSTDSPSSTTVDQDAPSPKENHDLDVAHMNNDPFFGIPIPKNVSKASSFVDVIPTIVHTAAPNSEHVTKWTKDHPLNNIIGELERLVSTRL
ncbi:retrovirus-related pol polyprotein from transposon TNT 1-94 [Tanacetum coccineum]|uniref:Retrovirus-related pol polyprotein from transposon TNT 1-94 n=1 Tax=Tanacetum coccineum TaxID=301880 RepID=A0ABQ5G1Y2_9ASTR